MIHTCDACKQKYLVSEHYRLCGPCGEYLRQKIERLDESDGAVEWWQVACEVASGKQLRRQPRWRIR